MLFIFVFIVYITSIHIVDIFQFFPIYKIEHFIICRTCFRRICAILKKLNIKNYKYKLVKMGNRPSTQQKVRTQKTETDYEYRYLLSLYSQILHLKKYRTVVHYK